MFIFKKGVLMNTWKPTRVVSRKPSVRQKISHTGQSIENSRKDSFTVRSNSLN